MSSPITSPFGLAELPLVSQPVPPAPGSFIPSLAKQEASEQARLLKTLADPERLRILSLLHCYAGLMRVEDIVTALNSLEQPSVSHHLRILRDAHLIDCDKVEQGAYYYISPEALKRAEPVLMMVQTVLTATPVGQRASRRGR